MSDKPPISRLSYRASPVSAAVIAVLSLFCQWLNWFAFDKLNYPWPLTLVTPLILCMMYHFVQLDAGSEGNFSRRFFFIFSVIVPLGFSILVTVLIFLANPDIFSMNEGRQGTSAPELIATYTGRFVMTSLYLMIFAAIDRLLLRKKSSS